MKEPRENIIVLWAVKQKVRKTVIERERALRKTVRKIESERQRQ